MKRPPTPDSKRRLPARPAAKRPRARRFHHWSMSSTNHRNASAGGAGTTAQTWTRSSLMIAPPRAGPPSVGRERRELVRPEQLHLVEPSTQLGEPFATQAVHAPASVLGTAGLIDQAA